MHACIYECMSRQQICWRRRPKRPREGPRPKTFLVMSAGKLYATVNPKALVYDAWMPHGKQLPLQCLGFSGHRCCCSRVSGVLRARLGADYVFECVYCYKQMRIFIIGAVGCKYLDAGPFSGHELQLCSVLAWRPWNCKCSQHRYRKQ